MIITIDGPSASGKTTIAKMTAQMLGFDYFDTGILYRALAFLAKERHLEEAGEVEIVALFDFFAFRVEQVGVDEKRYILNGEDITVRLSTQQIAEIASRISAMPGVRAALKEEQRRIAKGRNIVVAGRDMGSVIFPDAKLKIFLTAGPKVRAERRYKELLAKFPARKKELNLSQILTEIEERDLRDSSRKTAPLIRPKGAKVIDSSFLSPQEVANKIIKALYRVCRARGFYRFTIFLCYLFFKVFYRFKVVGLENYRPGAAIIAVNHTSFLDPPAAAAASPDEIHFLARDSLFKNKLFGKLIYKLNAHQVAHGIAEHRLFKQIAALLDEGKKVLLFPEGTRSESGEIGKLMPGIAFLANYSKVRIIPVYVHGAHKAWGVKSRWPKLFGKITVMFGEPIEAERFARHGKKEAVRAILKSVSDAFETLKKRSDNLS